MIMKSPYYAVIFSSILSEHSKGYSEMAEDMEHLARQQIGFLGMDSAKGETGITISYWKDIEAIKIWKANLDHIDAQRQGKDKWYQWYQVRICKVEKEYSFEKNKPQQ